MLTGKGGVGRHQGNGMYPAGAPQAGTAAAGAGMGRGAHGAHATGGGGTGAAGGGLQRGSSFGGGRVNASGLLGASSSALLCLNLPAINIRRSGTSGDGTGSPLIRQSLDQIQLSVRITAGGSSGGSSAAAAAAAAAAGSSGGACGTGAVAATAAALQPLLQHLPPRRQQAARVLQRKMDRLDMILSKLTATANMYGWRLETQEPLPPLLPPMQQQPQQQQRQGGGGKVAGGAGHRSRSQPTSPTGTFDVDFTVPCMSVRFFMGIAV